MSTRYLWEQLVQSNKSPSITARGGPTGRVGIQSPTMRQKIRIEKTVVIRGIPVGHAETAVLHELQRLNPLIGAVSARRLGRSRTFAIALAGKHGKRLRTPFGDRDVRAFVRKDRGPKCFKCLEFGHVKAKCSSDVKCLKCKTTGHMVKECPSRVAKKRKRSFLGPRETSTQTEVKATESSTQTEAKATERATQCATSSSETATQTKMPPKKASIATQTEECEIQLQQKWSNFVDAAATPKEMKPLRIDVNQILKQSSTLADWGVPEFVSPPLVLDY